MKYEIYLNILYVKIKMSTNMCSALNCTNIGTQPDPFLKTFKMVIININSFGFWLVCSPTP